MNDEAWLTARRTLLAKEKQLNALRDELSAMRRALPRRKVTTRYTFASPDGAKSLADLFGGRSQLLIYHFMFGADWDAGCPSCSFWADHFDAMVPHLRQRDTNFVVVSGGPLQKLTAYAERLGWRFDWVSSAGTSFNRDFAVSFEQEEVDGKDKLYNHGTLPAMRELPGATALAREGDDIFHTYSTYARGLDALNPTYQWLDLTARGRDESQLEWPMAWVRRHDEYA